MVNLGGMSLRCLTVVLRYARMYKVVPNCLNDWEQSDNDKIKSLCVTLESRWVARGR